MNEGGTGVVRNGGIGPEIFTNYSILFENNTYILSPPNEKFYWQDLTMSPTDWVAAGHDLNGQFFQSDP